MRDAAIVGRAVADLDAVIDSLVAYHEAQLLAGEG